MATTAANTLTKAQTTPTARDFKFTASKATSNSTKVLGVSKSDWERVQILMGCAAVVAFFSWLFFNGPSSKEKIESNIPAATVTECAYPLGSWFHMDQVSLSPAGVQFVKKGFYNDEIETIPYDSVKTIAFDHGSLWSSMKITRKNFLEPGESIYFRDQATYEVLKAQVTQFCPQAVELHDIVKHPG